MRKGGFIEVMSDSLPLPDIKSRDLELYIEKDVVLVCGKANGNQFLNVIPKEDIVQVNCDGDSAIRFVLHNRAPSEKEKKFREGLYSVKKGESTTVVELIAKIMILKMRRGNVVVEKLTQIAKSLDTFVENVSFSVGSKHFEDAEVRFDESVIKHDGKMQ